MKQRIAFASLFLLLMACSSETTQGIPQQPAKPMIGTWKLLTGTIIENGDTTVTDYTQDVSFIKIINDSHFAFMQHDLSTVSDSAAIFAAGGGRYSLTDSLYIEHLEYCSAREWEGHDFSFTVSIRNDTLIQKGIEQVESAGINRLNIEKYVKVKQ